jgi:hypothetical protein
LGEKIKDKQASIAREQVIRKIAAAFGLAMTDF